MGRTTDVLVAQRVGQVRISLDLLADLLFPEGTRIICAYQKRTGRLGCDELVLQIEHADLPATARGQLVPELSPEYRSLTAVDGSCRLTSLVFNSWGLPSAMVPD